MKTIAWIFAASLPLIAVVLFWGAEAQPEGAIPAGVSSIQPSKAAHAKGGDSTQTIKVKRLKEEFGRLKADDSTKDARQLLGEKLSPKVQRDLVNVGFNSRKDLYLKLVQSWRADGTTEDRVLNILYERDVDIMGLSVQFLEQGRVFADENQRTSQKIKDDALNALAAEVGRSHADELLGLEEKMIAQQTEHVKQLRIKTPVDQD